MSEDLGTVTGVSAVRVRLRSLRPARLLAAVDMSVATDAATLCRSFDGPLARTSRALGVDDVEAEVRVRFVDASTTSRVQ